MKHPDDPLYIPLGLVPKCKPMPQPEGCSYPICKCTVMPPKWQTCAVHMGRDPMRSHGVTEGHGKTFSQNPPIPSPSVGQREQERGGE